MFNRKLAGTKKADHNEGSLKCAMDHILDAQQKGEINEDNVLYIVENINVAGKYTSCKERVRVGVEWDLSN